MTALERAVAVGHWRATVKGYWDKRERQLSPAPKSTGPNIAGWQALAAKFPGNVQRGGERLVAV